jgi:class 3 adenylate cyclase
MKPDHSEFDFDKSIERVEALLSGKDEEHEISNEIPAYDSLTFKNGYYVNCMALFADIRKSSELPNHFTKAYLARIYRSIISEIVAIINSNINSKEIFIRGDCVGGIFNTPNKTDVGEVITTAGRIQSMLRLINLKMTRKGFFKNKQIDAIKMGVGISWGKVLMIKAGYQGSGVNDIIWMGDAINEASKLCNQANSDGYPRVLITTNVHHNLNQSRKDLFTFYRDKDFYGGDYVNTAMNDKIDIL